MDVRSMEAIIGWSRGYQASTLADTAHEIKQGKNYYITSLVQAGQFQNAANVAVELVNLYSSPALQVLVGVVATVAQILVFPVAIGCAAVKQGHYDLGAATVNKFLDRAINEPLLNNYGMSVHLPELGFYSRQVCCFFAEHGDTILEWGSVALAIAIIVAGNPYFGVAYLVAVGYSILDRNGWIERRVSLFIETYMPLVTLGALIVSGTLVSRIICAAFLPLHISQSVFVYVQRKVDYVVREYFGSEGVSLDALDAPWKEERNLSFAQMKEILGDREFNYEINKAHLTKSVIDLSKMPVSLEFEGFLTLFNEIDWAVEKKYPLITLKLADDDRFWNFIKDKIGGDKTFLEGIEVISRTGQVKSLREQICKEELRKDTGKKILKIHIDCCLQALAKEKGQTKEAYAAFWLKEQMEALVNNLTGKTRVAGKQRDLEDARNQLQYVLPSLQSLPKGSIDLEDSLLKIALEGGDYCALGIKRASRELVSEAMLRADGFTFHNPREAYEFAVKRSLEERRYLVLQKFYGELLVPGHDESNERLEQPGENELFSLVAENVVFDQHTFDLYRQYLVFSFYPMTPFERFNFGMTEFALWEAQWRHFHPMFEAEYRYDNAFGKQAQKSYFGDVFLNAGGNVARLDYLRDVWAKKLESGVITQDQHDELIEIACNPEPFDAQARRDLSFLNGFFDAKSRKLLADKKIELLNRALDRLVLVSLGVLTKVA